MSLVARGRGRRGWGGLFPLPPRAITTDRRCDSGIPSVGGGFITAASVAPATAPTDVFRHRRAAAFRWRMEGLVGGSVGPAGAGGALRGGSHPPLSLRGHPHHPPLLLPPAARSLSAAAGGKGGGKNGRKGGDPRPPPPASPASGGHLSGQGGPPPLFTSMPRKPPPSPADNGGGHLNGDGGEDDGYRPSAPPVPPSLLVSPLRFLLAWLLPRDALRFIARSLIRPWLVRHDKGGRGEEGGASLDCEAPL